MARKTILLVDDVEMFLDLEKTFFHRDDLRVLVARDGAEAVELALAELPDLIFMDLFMPRMNGDEACERIKQDERGAQIPVVMVTQGGANADLARCREAGCDDVIFKPLKRSHFLDTARHYLGLTERAAPRVPAKLSVRYGTEAEQLSDFTVNISTGGLFLETASPLPVDTPLTLEFPLPGRDEPVVCRARVAWTNESDSRRRLHLPAGMGLQFLDLPLDDLQAIRDYIRQLCLEPPSA